MSDSTNVPEMKPVESSNLAAIGYDEASRSLFAEWKSGRTSVYEQVPPEVAADVVNAPSVGKAINASVKGHYNHRYL